MNLTHAYILMGDGMYEILHKREKKDTHVMNLRGANYVSKHYHDIVRYVLYYLHVCVWACQIQQLCLVIPLVVIFVSCASGDS
jgi:hypothetical protein